MSTISVRKAGLGDWETIVEFNCRLAAETEGKTLARACIEPGVRAILEDEQKGRYYVACDPQGHVIGQVMHTREWSDWRNGQIWWLQSVYVIAEMRRQGVFRRLFEHVLAQAQADPEVIGLRLYVEEHNQRGLETYFSLGMQRSGHLVLEHIFSEPTQRGDGSEQATADKKRKNA